MYVPRFRSAAFLLAATIGLGACTYNDGYGYSRVSVGYSSGGYCDPYYQDCYRSRYGRRAYDPWYGWYGDYYYPGIGFYIYDRWGGRRQWDDNHRRYWESRRSGYRDRDWNDRRWENWDGYRGDRDRDRDRRRWRRR
jgi:hypothetical protein